MAGPRAPFGSLSDHNRTAAMLASRGGSTTGTSYKGHAKTGSSAAKLKVEDSDSSSDSDSSDESETENDTNSADWAGKLKPSSQPAGVKANGQVAKKNNVKSAVSSSEDESSSEDKSDGVGSAKNKNSASDSEASDDSSSESDESDESDDEATSGAKIPKQPASSKAEEQDNEESESGSSDESESESESDSGAPANATTNSTKSPTQGKKQVVSKTPSQAQAEETSESESSGSESESESAEEVDQSKALEKSNGNASQNAAGIFGPNFQLRKAGDKQDAVEVARLFKNARAEGKQVWYFTAPASVPIEVIQERAIVLDQLKAGHAIASHNGVDYNASSDDTVGTSITLVIPSKTGDKYETLPVDRSIHIKTVTRFGEDADQTALAAPPTRKTPRPQPKGLKARYQPLGAPPAPMGKIGIDTSSESEDVDMDDAPLPLTSSETPKADNKKRKHGSVETPGKETASSSGKKKSKKARVDGAPSSTPSAVSKASEGTKSSKRAVKETPIAPPIIGHAASSPVPVTKPIVDAPSGLPSTQPTKSQRSIPSKVTPIRPPTIPGAGKA